MFYFLCGSKVPKYGNVDYSCYIHVRNMLLFLAIMTLKGREKNPVELADTMSLVR